jgi:hypothetical protein
MKFRAIPTIYIYSYLNRLAILWVTIIIVDLIVWNQTTDLFSFALITIFNDYLWWRQYDKI